MTAFLTLLPTLLELLPSIIKFIEACFGPQAGQGPQKLSAAVDLAKQLIPEIAPHLTDDPAKLAVVNDVISVGVKVMNATGMLPQADKG